MDPLAVIFVAGTLALLMLSRRSWVRQGSRGFYRLLAFEIILGMLVLNLRGWLRQPFVWHQLLSWLLLLGSIYLVIAAVVLLHRLGSLDASRTDPALTPIEKTTRLVTVGIYRYIRHPMYASLLFLAWGLYFKSPSLRDLALALLATACLTITALIEERENVAYFGQAYADYMQRTRRFIPFVI